MYVNFSFWVLYWVLESKGLSIKANTTKLEKCHNAISGNLLRNTTIYIYNHRFKRVVAKGKSDENGNPRKNYARLMRYS